jgi:hypothetical protein
LETEAVPQLRDLIRSSMATRRSYSHSRTGLLGVVTAWAFCCAASAAAAQTPGYITAKPDRTARAFGGEVARKIFSNAYTPARQQAVLRSQKSIPGFECPADPQIALADIIPYPVKPGAVSWIERYVVACTPRTIRSFLLILEGDTPRMLEMLPSATNTDPLLQRAALKGATAATAALGPSGCERRIVTDTRLVSKIERGAPWQERWAYDLCGTKAEVELTFTPSERSGTTWSAKLIK